MRIDDSGIIHAGGRPVDEIYLGDDLLFRSAEIVADETFGPAMDVVTGFHCEFHHAAGDANLQKVASSRIIQLPASGVSRVFEPRIGYIGDPMHTVSMIAGLVTAGFESSIYISRAEIGVRAAFDGIGGAPFVYPGIEDPDGIDLSEEVIGISLNSDGNASIFSDGNLLYTTSDAPFAAGCYMVAMGSMFNWSPTAFGSAFFDFNLSRLQRDYPAGHVPWQRRQA